MSDARQPDILGIREQVQKQARTSGPLSQNLEFKEELRVVLNRNSVDAQLSTPDFILADAIALLMDTPTFQSAMIKAQDKGGKK